MSLVPSLVLACHAILSLMRGVALYKNFSASFEIYTELNKPVNKFIYPHLENSEQLNVCVSKEWYRFPSSFFIPEDINLATKKQKWRLRYLESDFKGQLPGVFNEALRIPESTRFVDKKFNDENKEVRQRYADIMKCHYFIDTDNQEEHSSAYIQLNYKNKKTETKWKTLSQLRFLDSSHSENRLLRSFYVPYLYEANVKFTYFKLRVRMI
jgi:alpha-1,2-mannosyltransferase